MDPIEFLIFLMFVFNMSVLGTLSYITLRNLEEHRKEVEELRYEVERLKRTFTLWDQRFNRKKNTSHNRK